MTFRNYIAAKSMIGILTWAFSVSSAHAGVNESVENALIPGDGQFGKISFDLQYRYEYVDQKGAGTANGDPIRLRLGYLTPTVYNTQAFLEFEGNTPVFKNDYNSLRNGKTQFPVIADPQEAELNQGWLAFTGIPDTTLKAGRQRITYNNHRFIGNVGWRQLEQTYDSATLVNKSLYQTDIKAGYIFNVKNVLSQDINMSSPILNLSYNVQDIGILTGYGYWLDFNNTPRLGLSSQTYGIRFSGATTVIDNLKALYTAEYANQLDYQKNPSNYNADYYHAIVGFKAPQLGWGFSNLIGKVGWEQLGSNNGVAFQTPLGTNHAFNGWADQFLVTPPTGIQDLYGSISAKLHGVKMMVVYHQFDSAVGNIDYGHEIDALIVKKFGKHYRMLAKYAQYYSRNFKTDTQKFWLAFGVNF